MRPVHDSPSCSGVLDHLAERRASREHALRDRYEAAGGDDWSRDGDAIVREELRRRTLDGTDRLLARMRAAHPGGWSAGAAEWAPRDSTDQLLHRADMALYQRKRTRNR